MGLLMGSDDNPNGRHWRNILVDRKYQLAFMRWYIFQGFLVAGLFGLVMAWVARSTWSILLQLGTLTPTHVSTISDAMNMVIVKSMGILSLVVILMGIVGLKLSHRTAGPLRNLKNSFERVKHGDFSVRCITRKDDHFKDVTEAFNEMVAVLDNQAALRTEQLAPEIPRNGAELSSRQAV